MKAKGITYNQIAKALDISLSTVKRDFALKNLSLSRFLSICEITNISLKDLSQSIEVSQPKTHILTDEQEAFFAKNITEEDGFTVGYDVFAGAAWTYAMARKPRTWGISITQTF